METFDYSNAKMFNLLGGVAKDDDGRQEYPLGNPLDDGMADLKTMYSKSDIVVSQEGVITNHNTGRITFATGYIMSNEEHGDCFLVISEESPSWVYWQKLQSKKAG